MHFILIYRTSNYNLKAGYRIYGLIMVWPESGCPAIFFALLTNTYFVPHNKQLHFQYKKVAGIYL